MEITYAFFAEAAQITSDSRVNILGADLHTLPVQGAPPWASPMMALLVSVQMDREDCGRLYHFTADMLAPDGKAIDPHVENDFIAPVPDNPELIARMSLVLQMNGVTFPAAGVYHMHVRVEDRDRNIAQERRVNLRVVEVVPQQQPA